MGFYTNKYTQWALVMMLAVGSLSAQDQVHQKEVDRQTQFIEAKKFLLIGRSDKAIDILEKLQKTNRKNAVIAYELYNLYLLDNNQEEALRHINRAVEYDGDNEAYLLKAARLSTDLGNYPESTTLYKKLVSMTPDNKGYNDDLAQSYIYQEANTKALEVYENIEKRQGKSYYTVSKKVEILDQMDRKEAAITELSSLLEVVPDDVGIMSSLAKRYIQQGNSSKAEALYQNILTIDKDHAEANMALAGNPDSPDNKAGYIKGLKPIIENSNIPVERKVNELSAFLESYKENKDQALLDAIVDLSESLKNTHPEDAQAYAMYGDVLTTKEAYPSAVEAYEKSLSKNDRKYSVWYKLMQAYDKAGMLKKLKARATEAIDYYPNQVTAYIMLARSEPSSSEALEYLDEAETIAGGNPTSTSEVLTEKAKCLLYMNKDQEAKVELQKAIDLDASNTQASEILSDVKAWKFMRGIK